MTTRSTKAAPSPSSVTPAAASTRQSTRKRKHMQLESVDGDEAPAQHTRQLRSRPKAASASKEKSDEVRHAQVKATSRKPAKEKGPKGKASHGFVYIAKVAHNDQFGEHEETLGVYASKAACAKVVREHIEKEYGTDLVEEYEVKKKGDGFVSVYASGWEGESMEVYMVRNKIQP